MEELMVRHRADLLDRLAADLPRVTKPTAFYRRELAASPCSPNASVVAEPCTPSLSLVCPVSLRRQSLPARTLHCAHHQTADLASFVHGITFMDVLRQGNLAQLRHWRQGQGVKDAAATVFQCPVCRAVGPLYVDQTVAEALATLPAATAVVVVDAAGRCLPAEVEEVAGVVTLSDSPYTTTNPSTPCFLLPGTSTPPYMPRHTAPSPSTTPSSLAVPPRQVFRRPSLERCLDRIAGGCRRYRRFSTVDLTSPN